MRNIRSEELRRKGQTLYDLFDANWASSTAKQYSYGWKAWVEWSEKYEEVVTLPADPLHVCLYLNDLSQEKKPLGTITNAMVGIRWGHLRRGYPPPTEDCLVDLAFKGASRIAANYKVSNQKEPFSPELIKKVCERYGKSDNLIHQRFLITFLIGYLGFLRIGEIRNLKVKDVFFGQGYINIFLDKSKSDQFREGNKIPISDTGGQFSLRHILLNYLEKTGLNDNPEAYILCHLVKTKKGHRALGQNSISYTTTRNEFLKLLEPVVPITESIKQYCTHSMRSGGATSAINNGVSERDIDLHGRWKSAKSRNRYLKDSLKRKLKISSSLGI